MVTADIGSRGSTGATAPARSGASIDQKIVKRSHRVRAAKAAGTKCIAVSSGAYSREELGKEKPDIIVNALTEKDTMLHFIFGSI